MAAFTRVIKSIPEVNFRGALNLVAVTDPYGVSLPSGNDNYHCTLYLKGAARGVIQLYHWNTGFPVEYLDIPQEILWSQQ